MLLFTFTSDGWFTPFALASSDKVKVIACFNRLNSSVVTVALFAVISLVIVWVATVGVYLVACGKSLIAIRFGLAIFELNSNKLFPAASVAIT